MKDKISSNIFCYQKRYVVSLYPNFKFLTYLENKQYNNKKKNKNLRFFQYSLHYLRRFIIIIAITIPITTTIPIAANMKQGLYSGIPPSLGI